MPPLAKMGVEVNSMIRSILSGPGVLAALLAFALLVLALIAIIATANYATRLRVR